MIYFSEEPSPQPSAPVISGTVVSSDGTPIEGATVRVFGTEFMDTTDASGGYSITGVPVAAPRYILIASKAGYIDGQQGNVDVVEGQTTTVNLTMIPEAQAPSYLKENLVVKFAWLSRVLEGPVLEPSWDAVLDPILYPENVRPYLEPGRYIESDDPSVVQTAEAILSGVPPGARENQTAVAKAVYDWVVKNIRYDLARNYPDDVTCGNWQTGNGAWGQSFDEWCYTPAEMLEERRGICIEFERLTTALLRALNIPARPAPMFAHPVTQWWVQLPDGSGYWANMETSVGSTRYEEEGDLWACFPSKKEHSIPYYAINENAIIHIEWYTENPCMWHESSPGVESYELTPAGYLKATARLENFRVTGELLPKGIGEKLQPPCYDLSGAGFSLNLANIGAQRTLTVKFPLIIDTPYRVQENYGYWTNHPEWVTGTWIENRQDPRTGEGMSWYCIEFEFG
jgi:hypothetical protein